MAATLKPGWSICRKASICIMAVRIGVKLGQREDSRVLIVFRLWASQQNRTALNGLWRLRHNTTNFAGSATSRSDLAGLQNRPRCCETGRADEAKLFLKRGEAVG